MTIVDLKGQPAGFGSFKDRLRDLIGGAEPTDAREEVITDAVLAAQLHLKETSSPTVNLMTCWFMWGSIRKWAAMSLPPSAQDAMREVDVKLAGLVMTMLYEAWRSLEEVSDSIDGHGEVASAEVPDIIGGEGTVPPVPSPKLGS